MDRIKCLQLQKMLETLKWRTKQENTRQYNSICGSKSAASPLAWIGRKQGAPANQSLFVHPLLAIQGDYSNFSLSTAEGVSKMSLSEVCNAYWRELQIEKNIYRIYLSK